MSGPAPLVATWVLIPLVPVALWVWISWRSTVVRQVPPAEPGDADPFHPGRGFRLACPVQLDPSDPSRAWFFGEVLADADHILLRFRKPAPRRATNEGRASSGEVRLARADVLLVVWGDRAGPLHRIQFFTETDRAGRVSCTSGRRAFDELVALGWPTFERAPDR